MEIIWCQKWGQWQSKSCYNHTKHKQWFSAAVMACLIYLLIHQCWSSLGLQCWLLQRYLLPETDTLKWSLVYPYRQLMKRWMTWRKCGPCPNVTPSAERHRVGCYKSNLAPFNRSLLLWFCCAFCSNVSSFASNKREPPATKGSNTTHKSITSQMPAVVQCGKTIARSAPRAWTACVVFRIRLAAAAAAAAASGTAAASR